jgi:hypothetical protein
LIIFVMKIFSILDRMSKFLLIIFLILSFSCAELYSQASGSIYNINTASDTVYMGMCMPGDTLTTYFLMNNTGSLLLKNINLDPSFIIRRTPDQPLGNLDYEEFFRLNDSISIEVATIDSLKIKYEALYDTANHHTGLKKCLIKIGLFPPKITDRPKNDTELTVFRNFIVFAKKTTHCIDFFDSTFTMDSCFIFPADTVRKTIKVQNSSRYSLNVYDQKITQISPIFTSQEMFTAQRGLPVLFPGYRSLQNWSVGYYPLDFNPDTSILKIYFKPNPAKDTIDSVRIKITGVGVQQKIDMTQILTDGRISRDTLDVGDVMVGDTTAIFNINFANNGSFPFGAYTQKMVKIDENVQSDIFSILNALPVSNSHLRPGYTDNAKINFSPKSRGNFVARYIFESDIVNRKIFGYSDKDKHLTFYIKGRGVEPEISTNSDTVNYGNVVLSDSCPNSRDSSILISNIGNKMLYISGFATVPPYPGTMFKILNDTAIKEIAPDSLVRLKINFTSNQEGEDVCKLYIYSNSGEKKDTMFVILKASGVPPISANLRVPKNLKAKPGTSVSIPIIVDNALVKYASYFRDTLTYDKTMLQFFDYSTSQTASAKIPTSSAYIRMNETQDGGRLAITVEVPSPSDFFLPVDTLIILKFNTFLGEKESTNISFTNPLFIHGSCPKVLLPKTADGIFRTDSVCGLEKKITSLTKGKFVIYSPNPNPANDKFDLHFEMPVDADVCIDIFNLYGELIQTETYKDLNTGNHLLTINVNGLNAGAYYLGFRSVQHISVLPLIISK